MKKKVTSLLMSLMLSLFVLTACGNNGQEAKEAPETNTQTEESAEGTESTEEKMLTKQQILKKPKKKMRQMIVHQARLQK